MTSGVLLSFTFFVDNCFRFEQFPNTQIVSIIKLMNLLVCVLWNNVNHISQYFHIPENTPLA